MPETVLHILTQPDVMHAANTLMSADDGNFATLLWRAGERFATRVAILERRQETTFAEVLERGMRVARTLAAAGIQPGDRIAVLLRRGPEAAASLFGTLAVGAIVVPVNKLYQPRQIEYVVRHSGSRALITSAELVGALTRPLDIAVLGARETDDPRA